MGIFKAYDIRGIYPDQIDEQKFFTIARAYAKLLKKENPQKKLRVVVAKDLRFSSDKLSQKVIEGLIDQGIDVIDIGLCATPTFYFAVGHYGYDGGLIVSASHNPKEYNGLKLTRHHAQSLHAKTGIEEIKRLVEENNFVSEDQIGSVTKKEGVLQDQIKHDLTFVDTEKLKQFKIVCDPANAMGALYIEELFKNIDSELIKMNFTLDANFPAHQPDPLQDETLTELKKKVIEEKADLGIATDGDGDRIFYIDNNGETIPQSIVRGLVAQLFLKDHPGATICYDIRPGKITKDMIEEKGGVAIQTRVGHSLIKDRMRKENAIFAGESSGHFFVKLDSGCYEAPVIITLKILEYLSEKNEPIAEVIRPYKRYYNSGEINSRVENKDAIIAKIAKYCKDGKLNDLDGITIEYEDYWFNIRKSNTEPLLRFILEAKTKEIMEEKTKELLEIIRAPQ